MDFASEGVLFSDEWEKYIGSLPLIKPENKSKYCQDDYDTMISALKKQELQTKKSKKMDEKLLETQKKIKELELKKELRPQYIEYAKRHKKIKFWNDDEMFQKCNQYHHMQKLNGKEVYTKCGKQDRVCKQRIRLKFVRKSWYVGGSCGCGLMYWSFEHPPDDLTKYNLSSTHTYGGVTIVGL